MFVSINYHATINASDGNRSATIPTALWKDTGAAAGPSIVEWRTAQLLGFPEPLVLIGQRGSVVRLANGSSLTTFYGSFVSDIRDNNTHYARTTMVMRSEYVLGTRVRMVCMRVFV